MAKEVRQQEEDGIANMKDNRTIEQMWREMASPQPVEEALNMQVKRVADQLKKLMDKEKNVQKKMKMADEVMQNILGEEYGAGEWGTDKLRKTYAKDTPGQMPNAELAVDGVPTVGGQITKPDPFKGAAAVQKPKGVSLAEEPDDESDSEMIEEQSDHPAAKALSDYANSRKAGIDKEYFHTAARHIAAGRHKELANHVKNGDTDPRDHVLDTIHKHDKALSDKIHKAAGFTRLREQQETNTELDEMMTRDERIAAIKAAHQRVMQKDKEAEARAKRDAKRGMKSPGATKGMADVKMEAKKLDPVGKADADIDNDGDVDKSDSYLHNRRKAIKKAMKKEEVEQVDEISAKTLSSYKDKATKDMPRLRDKMYQPMGKDHSNWKKNYNNLQKRKKGIETANKKLGVDESMMGAVKSKLSKLKKSVSDFHKTDVAAQIRKNKTTQGVKINELSNDLVKNVAKKRAMKVGSAMMKADGDRRDPEVQKAMAKKKANDSLRFSRGARKIGEEYTDKEIRMAKGIAFDPRHKGGDYTGAAKKMEKIKKGLSDHPKVKNALRAANESFENGTPTGVKIYHKDKNTGKENWTIHFTAREAQKHVDRLKKDGHTETKRSLMFGKKEGKPRMMSK
jgi:hypothetical protein